MTKRIPAPSLMQSLLLCMMLLFTLPPAQAQQDHGPATSPFVFASAGDLNPQDFTQTGLASFYPDRFHGRTTASGERYDHNDFTAAHRTLPFGTRVQVTNLETGTAVIVRINDRGPFVKQRIVDVSGEAAKALGFVDNGVARVRLTLIEGDAVAGKVPEIGPAATRPTQPTAPQFAVQLGVFSTVQAAQRFAQNIDGAWLTVTQDDGKLLHRVFFGVYDERAEANQAKEILMAKGHDGFVKPLPAPAAPTAATMTPPAPPLAAKPVATTTRPANRWD